MLSLSKHEIEAKQPHALHLAFIIYIRGILNVLSQFWDFDIWICLEFRYLS